MLSAEMYTFCLHSASETTQSPWECKFTTELLEINGRNCTRNTCLTDQFGNVKKILQFQPVRTVMTSYERAPMSWS